MSFYSLFSANPWLLRMQRLACYSNSQKQSCLEARANRRWVPRRASRRARLRRRRSAGHGPGQSQRGRRLEERRAGRPLPLRATPRHSVVSLGVHRRARGLAWLWQPRARARGREGRTEESSCKRALAPGPPLSSQLRPPRQRPPGAVLPWQVARGTSAPGTTTAAAANPARGCA